MRLCESSAMPPDKDNFCLNNLLCFVIHARVNLTVHEIVESCLIFYDEVDIEKSKALIYDLLGSTAPARRGPKKTRSHLEDILAAFDKGDEEHKSWPHFVASGPHPMPPTLGFFRVADTLTGLWDEVKSLRAELKALKESGIKSPDTCALKDIKDDIKFIKSSLLNQVRREDTTPPSSSIDKGADTPVSCETNQNSSEVDLISKSQDLPETFASKAAKAPPAAKKGTSAKKPPLRKTSTVKLPPPKKDASKDHQWHEVVTRNRKYRKIVGKGQCNSFFQGTERLIDLYIGGCNTDTTSEQILNHCKEILKIDPKDCTPLESNFNYYKAFKLKIKFEDRESVMKSECWPENTFINKFFKRRNRD